MIPKEAPWKTSALNEQTRKKRGCEFSTVTSGTERKRGFAGTFLADANLSSKSPLHFSPSHSLKSIHIKYLTIKKLSIP